MLILALDTATRVCSTALIDSSDGRLIAEYTQNIKKTHSQRLMPLIDNLIQDTSTSKCDLFAVAVAAGPGSFTGLRIGVSTARGLAQGLGVPAVGVSTLEALAYNLATVKGDLICPILDARRDQVYTALFRFHHRISEDGEGDTFRNAAAKSVLDEVKLEVLQDPGAMSINELMQILDRFKEPVYFPGDGIFKYKTYLYEQLGERFREVPSMLALNRASSVASCALRKIKLSADPIEDFSFYHLQPQYLRLPEAERNYQNQCQQQEA